MTTEGLTPCLPWSVRCGDHGNGGPDATLDNSIVKAIGARGKRGKDDCQRNSALVFDVQFNFLPRGELIDVKMVLVKNTECI